MVKKKDLLLTKKEIQNHPLARIKRIIDNPLTDDNLRLECLVYIQETIEMVWLNSTKGIDEWMEEGRRLLDEGEK